MNRFGKDEKIKSRAEMLDLFENGKSIKSFPIRLIWNLDAPPEEGQKAAFSAPKRSFKKAVTRNRLKRRMREAYRLNRSELEWNHVGKLKMMFVVQGSEAPKFQEIQDKIILLLQRLSQKLKRESFHEQN